MKKQFLTEEHHRRPRSIGGTENPANVSNVKDALHKSWHVLFGNMNVYQICDDINYAEHKPKNVIVVCKFINGVQVKKRGGNNSKNKHKISNAWETLFNGLNFLEIIEYINNVFLDPSYHFYVEVKMI